MKAALDEQRPQAVIIVKDPAAAGSVTALCEEMGIEVTVFEDPRAALDYCTDRPPDLAIVGDEEAPLTTREIIGGLLKISWTTHTILISEDDEETVHEKTEGLGILGHISGPGDTVTLKELLTRFTAMRSPAST